jgi:hypothetical protein
MHFYSNFVWITLSQEEIHESFRRVHVYIHVTFQKVNFVTPYYDVRHSDSKDCIFCIPDYQGFGDENVDFYKSL